MIGRMLATSVFGAAVGGVAGGYSTGGSAQGIITGAVTGAVGGGALGALSRTPRSLAGIKGPKQMGAFGAVGGAMKEWLGGGGSAGWKRLTSFATQGPSKARVGRIGLMARKMGDEAFAARIGIAKSDMPKTGLIPFYRNIAARGQMNRNIAGMAGIGIGGILATNFLTGGLGATFGTGVGAIGGYYGVTAGAGRGRGAGILGAVIGAGIGNYMTGGRLDTDLINRRRGRGMSYGY